MREIRVCQPKKSEKLAENAVRKLQFTADASRLLAWVAWEWWHEKRHWTDTVVYTHDLTTGQNRRLDDEWAEHFAAFQGDPAVSLESRFAVFEYDDWRYDGGGAADVIDLMKPTEPGVTMKMGAIMSGQFAFAPDGSALFAARNTRNREDHTAEVVRVPMDSVTRVPTRYRDGTNPFTGQPMRVPVRRRLQWARVATLPGGEAGTALALSGDGRLAAVGTRWGSLHVVDVKKKRVTFSEPWSGRQIHDRVALRVALHPGGEWVALLANGRVFAHPLKSSAGKEWQTKPSLGYLHDFAYHPAGRTVAAVDAKGRARYLDPFTGAVKKEFRWKRGPLYSVAFSPDGLLCAAGAGGGRVVLWDVDE